VQGKLQFQVGTSINPGSLTEL